MKILFIITPDDEEQKYKIKLGANTGYYIPLGIAKIAAILENENHEVKVLDIRLIKKERNKSISKTIKKFEPGVIAFSISFFSVDKLFRISALIKKMCDIPIIVGGPYTSVFSKDILKDGFIDIVVYGEGYYTFSEVLKALNETKSLNKVKGIYYKNKKGKIVKTKESSIIKDIDDVPFAAIHLFDINKYVPYPKHYKKLPVLPMITSRGCPWNKCTFCYHKKEGYYTRQSPERVFEEIKYFTNKYNIKEIRFWDDNFLEEKEWVLKFCELMQKENLNVIWSCHARVNSVTKSLINKIKEAGCWQIFYGAESGNQETLNKIKKGITLDQIRKAVDWVKEAGIEVRVSFMLGFPWETPDMTDKTIKYAHSLKPDYLQFSLVTPYPGTEMYDEYKNSKKLSSNIEDYCEYKVVYLPKGYKNKEQLEKKFKLAYRNFYLNPKYLIRSIKRIRNLNDIRRYLDGFKIVLNFLFSNQKNKK
jgi:anaerobic magnesium-protoporphyrin IX monomethyl ester cyclase